MPLESTLNPRHLREKYQSWVGKKVVVGLTTLHYLCGTWKSIEGYYAIFTIGGREQKVLLDQLDNIADAEPHVAEYFK
jgi:hypothetical protein